MLDTMEAIAAAALGFPTSWARPALFLLIGIGIGWLMNEIGRRL
jgi:hypothetical protein